MPPKKGGKGGAKKGKGGKKSGSKGPVIIDGVPASEMTRDQLEGHVGRLQAELQREQNSLTQVGQVTGTPWDLLPVQMWQMVSQPALGHQVLLASRDTSVTAAR